MSPLILDGVDRLRDMLASQDDPGKAKRKLLPFVSK
jgi:hypothetical protein